jgi:hypothetical protein
MLKRINTSAALIARDTSYPRSAEQALDDTTEGHRLKPRPTEPNGSSSDAAGRCPRAAVENAKAQCRTEMGHDPSAIRLCNYDAFGNAVGDGAPGLAATNRLYSGEWFKTGLR